MANQYLMPIFAVDNRLHNHDYRYVNVYKRDNDYYMSRYVERKNADTDPYVSTLKPLYRINIIPKQERTNE